MFRNMKSLFKAEMTYQKFCFKVVAFSQYQNRKWLHFWGFEIMTFPDKNSGCWHSVCCDNDFFSYAFVYVRTTWVGGSWMRVWRVTGSEQGCIYGTGCSANTCRGYMYGTVWFLCNYDGCMYGTGCFANSYRGCQHCLEQCGIVKLLTTADKSA